jgi:hypothetical protein
MHRSIVLLGCALPLSLVLTACDKTEEECATMSRVLAPPTDALQESQMAVYKANPERGVDLAKKQADALSRQSGMLTALTFTNSRIERRASDYTRIAKEMQQAAADLAAAYETLVPHKKTADAKDRAYQEKGEALKQACAKAVSSKTCVALRDVPPPGMGEGAFDNELEKYADRLEALTVDDEKIKEPMAARVAAARDFARAYKAFGTEQAKVDAVSARYFQELEKAKAVQQKLDKDCQE